MTPGATPGVTPPTTPEHGPRIVEAVTPGQLDVIRALFREYQAAFSSEASFMEYLLLQNFNDELAGLPGAYAPPSGALLLAIVDGRPQGCVAFKDLGEGYCEMKRLYVRPEARGSGIGVLLVREVIGRARIAGYRGMRLDTLAPMTAAQSLYRKFGFREIPPYCKSPVADAVYMELPL